MIRIADVVVIAALAVVLLMPKASVEAKAAINPLEVHKVDRDRLGALEDALAAEPDSVERAMAVADEYLHFQRPDWALGATARFVDSGAGGHKLRLLRATARAERLEVKLAMNEIDAGLKACDAEGAKDCADDQRVRFQLLSQSMQALLDGKIDPVKQPWQAKQAVAGAIHSTRTPVPSQPKK